MISATHNFIFVHVPKTAGTAIEEALHPYFETMMLGDKPFYDPAQRHLHKHATATMIRAGLEEAAFSRAFKFAFVRNPWDWAVSNCLGSRGGHFPYLPADNGPRRAIIERLQSFTSFRAWLPEWIRLLRPSQRAMLCDHDGHLLVDFVGRYETLARDFGEVCRRVGLSPPTLSIANRSPRRFPWADMYHADTFGMVREAFAEDIERFGYGDCAPITRLFRGHDSAAVATAARF